MQLDSGGTDFTLCAGHVRKQWERVKYNQATREMPIAQQCSLSHPLPAV